MSTTQKLLTPEEIAARTPPATPFLRLPNRGEAFAERAARLRTLAPGHAMQGYLEFIAAVAEEQHALIERMPPVRLPSAEEIKQCNEQGIPPIHFQTTVRDPQWRGGLRQLLRRLAERTTGRLAAVAEELERSSDEFLEAQAGKLLEGVTSGLDIAAAPLIAAGLQVYFTHLAIVLGPGSFPRIEVATVCPCCGSRPTASVVRIGGEAGYRFLHCALCNAEWHMVRVKCSHCESAKGVNYQAIDDGTPVNKKAVTAEACEECGTYLKILFMDRDPQVEPVADDLATLTLDLLVADTGKTASGINFMLIHGDPGPDEHVLKP